MLIKLKSLLLLFYSILYNYCWSIMSGKNQSRPKSNAKAHGTSAPEEDSPPSKPPLGKVHANNGWKLTEEEVEALQKLR